MSTLPIRNPLNTPKTVSFNVGDSLTKIANEVLGDSTAWRELATMNDLDIFKAIEVGQTLTIPNPEVAERKFKLYASTEISNISDQVQATITEITQSREAQTILNLLGTSQENILRDVNLSLSGLAKGIAPTSQDELLSKLKGSKEGTADNQNVWQLISWILP
ncbi:LysM peptidoglycan-binding domain-containing protein [Nostoc sp. 'Peltigera membranacea cyanobiont' N6]|uniref:LysM peptidoglycan-binding domain-containing protein n=1 Tax=Nostoc sp. 'Peltigera membranacea cyanobiont' N6 TaxID=1261031 RepID=UPI000CF302FC|nr:LysM peptidoglycan-binding domain-containing protein [Nostoc sp. 'Peltigera membranacea cyanobiont' N6]AVH67029.1 peptidoglycan-binding protein LysM [Nostoc sp. 'Peltigera membranacea cyanobiont' N6]